MAGGGSATGAAEKPIPEPKKTPNDHLSTSESPILRWKVANGGAETRGPRWTYRAR
jgi:hypothetical protein